MLQVAKLTEELGSLLSLVLRLMPQMMNIRELAEYLRLHECIVRNSAAGRKIPAIRIGRAWRFGKEAFDALASLSSRTSDYRIIGQ